MVEVIDNEVLRCEERDIIRVKVREDYIQPFYKSSGKNSQLAEQWLPFNGLYVIHGEVRWFDKSPFVCNNGGKYHNIDHDCLHRYGTEELKAVSQELGTMNIPEGVVTCPIVINEWIGYNNPFKEHEK